MGMTLYWGSGSPFAWRVMITLEEKGLEYESKLLSFAKQEHKTEQMLALNPRGQLPIFTDGDLVICESGATCLYLQSVYSERGTQLMPADKAEMATTLQRMYEAQNIISAAREFKNFFRPPSREGPEWPEYKESMRSELKIWERHVAGKEFLVGARFSLADAFLFPLLGILNRLGLDFAKAGFPALAEYHAGLSTRDSIVKSTPPHWKESAGQGLLVDF